MSDLSLEQLSYYLPQQFVYLTTRNSSKQKQSIILDEPPNPGQPSLRPFTMPGASIYDTPAGDPLDVFDNNGQGIYGIPAGSRPPSASVSITDRLLANIKPQITSETGYSFYFSPVNAEIPTSWYNIYNIDFQQGNDTIFVQVINTDTNDIHYNFLEIPQGNYTPNNFATEVEGAIKYWIDQLRTVDGVVINGDLDIEYREQARKYLFTNDIYGVDTDDRPWEFRFFLIDYWDVEQWTSESMVSPRLCFSPLGLTIPNYDKYPEGNFYNFNGNDYAYWRVPAQDDFVSSGEMWSMRNIDLRRSSYIAMVVEDDTGSATNEDINAFGDSNRILFSIPVPINYGADETIPSTLEFKPTDTNFKINVSVLGITNLNTINFGLIDSNGVSLNMNGVDWCATIQVRQIPTDNSATQIEIESLESFLRGLPEFNRDDPGNIQDLKPMLNPAKFEVFKKRLEEIRKKKGRITFNSILNNLEGEKQQIVEIDKESGTKKIIPDVNIEDIGLKAKTPEQIAFERQLEREKNKN